MRKPVLLLSTAALAFTVAVAAQGATIAVGQVGPYSPSGVGDVLALGAATTSFNAPTTLMQTGTFYAPTLSGVMENFNFNFIDTITIEGVTENVTVNGTESLGSTNSVSFLATGPILFATSTVGNLDLNIPAATFTGTGTMNIALTGNIISAPVTPPSPVPEPSSIALLGTGILGVAGVARRKFLRV